MVVPSSFSSAPPFLADGCAGDRWERPGCQKPGASFLDDCSFSCGSFLISWEGMSAFFHPRAAVPETLLRVASPSPGARLGGGALWSPRFARPSSPDLKFQNGSPVPLGGSQPVEHGNPAQATQKGKLSSPCLQHPCPPTPHKGTSGCLMILPLQGTSVQVNEAVIVSLFFSGAPSFFPLQV